MVRRQAVVVLAQHSVDNDRIKYSVRYRERGWFMWRPWRTVVESHTTVYGWDYKNARLIADQAMANGVVPSTFRSEWCNVVVELDEE